ncbi:MAG: HlyC/CorC family transporter [Calditrichaeota bacterium]|nr:HlyC/CorC family transporter [Calditrichota bacterium]
MLVLAASAGAAATSNDSFQNGSAADVTLLLVYVFSALLLSFLCSIAEAVLLSLTPSYIEAQRDKRPRYAARLRRMKQDNLDQSLAAILTLNTIAHTVGAIGAGAKAAVVFGSAWFGLFSALMTLGILFLSEILPKTIGALHWSKFVAPTALFVRILIVILYPLVWISEKLTKSISHGKAVHVFSRDEFIAMARVGENSGYVKNSESRIIQSLFRFGDLKVTDIMTPCSVMTAVQEDQDLAEGLEIITQKPFSRLPLYNKDIDDITGFVLRADILLANAQDRSQEPVKSLKREIHTVPGTVSLTTLLERLIKERQHIAIVVNEYGGTEGLVTLEDLLETLIGVEIFAETEKVEDMRALLRERLVERTQRSGEEVENSGE